MFGFVKKVFFTGLSILSSFTSINWLSCISMNNQECKTRTQVVNAKGDELVFFPFSFKRSKCSGSCNNINYPDAKICVPDIVKNLNVKVFNLMSRTNETRHTKWHETCKCECKFGPNICNNKQRWNKDKCRCECKEIIDKLVIGNCECESDKACDVGEYLDYENCKCRKKIVDKLVEECTETVEEVKLAKITLDKNENKYKCSSFTLYIVLVIVAFKICARIGTYFIYYNWSLVKNVSHIQFNTRTRKLLNGRSQTN